MLSFKKHILQYFLILIGCLFCTEASWAQSGGRFTENLEFVLITANGSATPALEAGGELVFSVTVRNNGTAPFQNCELHVTTIDPYVTFHDSTESFDYIAPGNQYALNNCASCQISPNIPDGHVITFAFLITNDLESAIAYRSYRVQACSLSVVGYEIRDNGNYNSLVNTGETATLLFTLHNDDNRELQNLVFSLECDLPGIQVVSSPMIKDSLWGDETFPFQAVIRAGSTFADGTTFDVRIQVTRQGSQVPIGSYIVPIVGVTNCEEFSDGIYPPTMYGDSVWTDWRIDSLNAHSGLYSLRSGAISHSDTSEVNMPVTVNHSHYVSFAFRTSTENNYDWLYFFIDGVQKGRWSGANDWTEISFAVQPGTHTLTWRFTKDHSVSTGSDCVWIDDICLSNYNEGYPSLAITPDSIGVSLDEGGSSVFTRTLHFTNESDIYLIFDTELQDEQHNPVGWVEVATPNGSVNAHQSRDIVLNFNINGYFSGSYKALLRVTVPELDTVYRIPIVLDNRVSVEDPRPAEALPVTLFPNPTAGTIVVRLETQPIEKVLVTDALGRVRQSVTADGSECRIDLSGLPHGLYLLQVFTADGDRVVVKAVKE